MTATDKSRGMLFSAPMILALLNTKPGVWPAEPIDPSKPFKSQTRRILKEQPPCGLLWSEGFQYAFECKKRPDGRRIKYDPPHPVGSLIYARESYYQCGHWEIVEGAKTKGGKIKWAFVADFPTIPILFDEPKEFRKGRHSKDPSTPAWHKRLGRFMPRAASRMLLKVMGVRVERCSSISPEDAIAEGIEGFLLNGERSPVWKDYAQKHYDPFECFTSPIDSYKSLIESINGPEAWDKYVWAYSLKRLK